MAQIRIDLVRPTAHPPKPFSFLQNHLPPPAIPLLPAPAMALLRARIRREPLLPRQFSSSSSSRLPPPPPQPAARPRPHSPTSAISSAPRPPPPPPSPRVFPVPHPNPASASASSPRNDDLRHKLRHFPRPPPSTPTTPNPSAPSSPGPSFIDLFATTPHAPNRHSPSATSLDYATLRDSLSKSGPAAGGLPFPGARKFDLKTSLSQLQGRGLKSGAGSILVQREYSYDELGKRLGDLRPAGAGKDGKEWFSLEELSARVGRLREMEKEERERATLPGKSTEKLRAMLLEHSVQTQDQKKTGGVLSVAALMGFGGQTVQGKPQEELMERYFHPDHMSSAEKMKLELQRLLASSSSPVTRPITCCADVFIVEVESVELDAVLRRVVRRRRDLGRGDGNVSTADSWFDAVVETAPTQQRSTVARAGRRARLCPSQTGSPQLAPYETVYN
ncbi:hypothetical protein HU200_035570 [Digitaria exilis]|uniref:Uncharacterized protein n=1 Tax=Digitaria exilis TaxID=1010633 RepID=A0A835BG72_9POAL|nr:hypothetical protein HU200_035570 [Digitaria exilis]